jgi:MFS family permease
MPSNLVHSIKSRLSSLLRFIRKRPYLVSCLILVISAILIGLDNPTGIITGWLAVIVLLVSMSTRWWTPWYFLILMAGSFLGAIFLSFLYMVVALPIAEWISGPAVTDSNAWRVFHMIISNLILLFVPMGLFFGAVGFVLLCVLLLLKLIRRKRSTNDA